tara:strand:+ start:49 stop:456 length:408 start_codon:yes stop_codon:yes gene_type:complete
MIISNAGWFVLLFHILVLIWAPTIQKSAVFREKYKKHIKPLIPKGVLWGKHLVASLLATGYGAIWGLLLPESIVGGARFGAFCAFVFSGSTEAMRWRSYAEKKTPNQWKFPGGWGLSGIMNVTGPMLVHLWTWML